MYHVYVTQSSLNLTCRASGNFALVCLSFIAEMKSNKDTRYKQTNCRPDYVLESIDIWCRFWKLCCFVIRTWIDPNVYIGEASSNNAPEGQDKSSSLTAEKMAWNFKPNVYKTSMYHCGTWDFLNLTYFCWNICWRIDLCRAEPPFCQVRKVKLHLNAPWALRSQKNVA